MEADHLYVDHVLGKCITLNSMNRLGPSRSGAGISVSQFICTLYVSPVAINGLWEKESLESYRRKEIVMTEI